MRLVRFVVPGRFEDAYLYMGHLVALTRDRTIRIAPVAALLDTALGDAGRRRELARLLFERNDRLTAPSRQTSTAAALKRHGKRLSEVEEISREKLATVLTNGAFAEYDPRLGAAVPLDVLIYNQRMYVGSTEGLFHVDLQFDPWPAVPRGRAKRRPDARCLFVSARFGAIAASAEEAGLFVSFDEFRWADARGRRGLRRVAPRSRRTSWAGFGMYNYETNRRPEALFGNVIEVSPSGIEQERRVLRSIGTRSDANQVAERLASAGIRTGSIQYIWSTQDYLFIHDEQGTLSYLATRGSDGTSVRLGRPHALPEIPGRIIHASSTAHFSIVETDYSTWAVVDGQLAQVVDAEAISVRTYPSSKWFRNVSTATLSDEIVLTAVVGRPLA